MVKDFRKVNNIFKLFVIFYKIYMNLENLEQKSKPVEIHTERKKDREIENAESNILSCLMGWPMFLIAVDDL